MIIQKSRNLGFTIVELIIVISVIAILASLTVVAYNGMQQGARDKSVLSDIENMDAAQTRYSIQSGASGKAYYSGSGYDADLDFSPSTGDVIDVVLNNIGYCIRGYNTGSSKKSITDPFIKESTPGICIDLAPSVAAGGTGASSLVGWWKLNGSAIDSSGNNFNGTVNGATLTIGQDGRANGAYSFDGISQYIDLTGFDQGVMQASAYGGAWTLSIWGKGGSSSNERVLLGRQGCNGGIYTFGSKYTFAIKGSGCWTGSQTVYGSSVDATNWHLFTATYNAGQMVFYQDGVLMGSATIADMYNYSTRFGIGSSGGSGTYSFAGSLDDARVYNKSLSIGEVQSIYKAGAQ